MTTHPPQRPAPGEPPRYPRGGDPHRRQRLNNQFQRRRISRELDRLCGVEPPAVDVPDADGWDWDFSAATGADPECVRQALRFIDQVDRRRAFDRGEAP